VLLLLTGRKPQRHQTYYLEAERIILDGNGAGSRELAVDVNTQNQAQGHPSIEHIEHN
jgi:hypothetical protein